MLKFSNYLFPCFLGFVLFYLSRDAFYNIPNYGKSQIQFLAIFLSLCIYSIFLIKSKINSVYYASINVLLFLILCFFYGNILAFIGVILFLLVLIFVGFLFEKKDIFKTFCIGYVLLTYALYIPFLYNWINIRYFYYASFAIFILIFMLKRKTVLYSFNNLSFKNNTLNNLDKFLIIFYSLLLLMMSNILSFCWDDLNSYLYFPLKSLRLNHSVLSPEYPGSLLFVTMHSLSIPSFITNIISPNWYNITYIYKYFNAVCYICAFLFFIKTYRPINNISNLLFIGLLFGIPYILCEITYNITDFPAYLVSLYILYELNEANWDFKNITLSYKKMLFFSMFVAVNLKTVAAILPFLLLFTIYNFEVRKSFFLDIAKKLFIMPVFLFPIFIRNYILSGNPVLPITNEFWQSPYWPISKDATKNIVKGFLNNWPLDHTAIFNLLSPYSVPKSTTFAYFEQNTYGMLLPFLFFVFLIIFPTLILIKNESLVYNKKAITNLYYLSILTFISVYFLQGPVLRYFIPFIVFISAFFVYFISGYLSLFKYNRYAIVVIILVLSIFDDINRFSLKLESYSLNERTRHFITNSNDNKDWLEKIKFYTDANKLISSDDKLLIFYLQDKIFIQNNHVFEWDWYDYNEVKNIPDVCCIQLRDALCARKFTYLILSTDRSNYAQIGDYLELKLQGKQQSLYKLKCGT